MPALSNFANGSGVLYIVDNDGVSILGAYNNDTNGARKFLSDALVSGALPPTTGIFSTTYGHRYFLNSTGGASPLTLSGATEISRNVIDRGLESTFPFNTYTLASNVLTPLRDAAIMVVNVESQGGSGTDTLNTITTTDYNAGDIIIFRGVNPAHVITFTSAGNITLANALNFISGDNTHSITLQYNGTSWFEISRTPNPIVSVATLRNASIAEPVQGVDSIALTNAGGTINVIAGVNKEYQRITGSATLVGSYNIVPVVASPPLDGDRFHFDYDATMTVGGNTITIAGITLTTGQALAGKVWVEAYYQSGSSTWRSEIFQDTSGEDLVNSTQLATKEDFLGTPAANGYVLSSTTGNVRSWIPISSAMDDLWETGSGSLSIQTKGNGANASGNTSIAFGLSAIASGTQTISIGQASNSTANSGIAIGIATHADGIQSIAIGQDSDANDDFSIAIGGGANAFGMASIAIGEAASTATLNSIAIGISATTTSDNSIAIGNSALTIDINGVSIGNFANVSGLHSIGVGFEATTVGDKSIAIGWTASSVASSVSIGNSAQASSINSLSIGIGSNSNGISSNAIGNGAIANISNTTALNGVLITQQSYGSGTPTLNYSSSVVTITTDEIDLKTINTSGTGVYLITIPTGAKFYPDSVDLAITTLGGTFTGQPTIEIGKTGSAAFLLAAVATSGLGALFDRQRFSSLLVSAGQQTLTVGVTAAAAGSSTIKGRFTFKGTLIEAQ